MTSRTVFLAILAASMCLTAHASSGEEIALAWAKAWEPAISGEKTTEPLAEFYSEKFDYCFNTQCATDASTLEELAAGFRPFIKECHLGTSDFEEIIDGKLLRWSGMWHFVLPDDSHVHMATSAVLQLNDDRKIVRGTAWSKRGAVEGFIEKATKAIAEKNKEL